MAFFTWSANQDGTGGGSGTDDDAVHVNIAAEITGITEKASPTGGDFLIIEDGADSNNKKKVNVANLPTGGGGEANTASNVGSAIGVFKQKTGIDLEFKSIIGIGAIVPKSNTSTVELAFGGMTGLTEGGVISVNAGDPATFDITAGKGIVVDYTDPDNPVVTEVTWVLTTDIALTNIGTQATTTIGFNSSGTLVQFVAQQAAADPAVQRANIIIGNIAHPSGTTISGIANVAFHEYGLGNTVLDLAVALGPINSAGNVFAGNIGGNLTMDKSAGIVTAFGTNSKASVTSPNTSIESSLVPVNFFPVHQDGSGATTILSPTTLVDVANYDDGSGTLASVPNNRYQIKRMYLIGPGIVAQEYGQNTYLNLDTASSALPTEAHNSSGDLASSLFRGWLIVKQGTTDLTNAADAKFVNAGKLGSPTSAGGQSGEINTASNVGSATGEVFKQKTGVNLELRTIASGSTKLTVTNNTSTISLDVVEANLTITESQISDLDHTDTDAVHDNVNGEFNAISDKASPAGADLLIIEDSAATFGKKKISISNIPITESQITDLDHTDTDAIHDNVSGEVNAITVKGTPIANDVILVEDSAASFAKKKITIGSISITESQISDLDHTDTTAVHDNVSGEINAVTTKATPVANDVILVEDSAATFAKKKITIGSISITESQISDLDHTDTDAIHDNVTGEINAITVKGTPVNADVLIIEDSAASFGKKKITVGSLPSGGGGEANTASNVGGATGEIFKQKTSVDLELKTIAAGSTKLTVSNDTSTITLDVDESNLTITESQISDLDHTDTDAIHDNVTGEINAVTLKATPVSADVILIEDSAASFAKKKITLTDLLGGGGGEANTASNVGSGTGKVFKQKTSLDLEMKSIATGSTKLSINNGVSDVTLDVVEANINHDNLSGFVAGEHIAEGSLSLTQSQISDTTITNSTYSPTYTSITNMASTPTGSTIYYSRLNTTVHVWGAISVSNSSSGGAYYEFRLSLPVAPATNFTDADGRCTGVMANSGTGNTSIITGPVSSFNSGSTNEARVQGHNLVGTGGRDCYINFTYRI